MTGLSTGFAYALKRIYTHSTR